MAVSLDSKLLDEFHINITYTSDDISINFDGYLDESRIPLKKTIDKIIHQLQNQEPVDELTIEVNRFNEVPPTFGVNGNYLILESASIRLDKIREETINLFKLIGDICPKTKINDYLNEIYDMPKENLPIIKKIDGTFKLIQNPKNPRGYYDFRTQKFNETEIKTIIDFLSDGNDGSTKLNNDIRLDKRCGHLQLFTYGHYGNEYICYGINDDTVRENLIKELPKLLEV